MASAIVVLVITVSALSVLSFSVRVEPLLFTVAITTILFDAYVSGKVNTAVVPLILILVG